MLAGNTAYAPSVYDSIQTITVGSGGAAYVEFTSIPSTYKYLQLVANSRNVSNDDSFYIQFNGDTGTNYSWSFIAGTGATTRDLSYTDQNYISQWITSVNSSGWGGAVIDIFEYSNPNKYKTVRTFGGYEDNNALGHMGLWSGQWRSTSTITSIKIFGAGNHAQYSDFALYGIRG